MKTMTEISHVLVFVPRTYVTSNSTVFERFCVDSRKRIETPVMWTRIDRCISVDRAKIGNGNGNAKKAIGISKTTTMHANYAFCMYISMPSQHHYDEKLLNFTSCGGLELRQRFSIFSVFLTQIYKQSFRIQLQKYSPTFD